MENESKGPLSEEIVSQQRPAPSIIPEGQFRFEPIADLFETPETNFNDLLMSGPLAADEISGVNEYKADIDKYGISAMASLGVGVPSFATDTYNPIAQDQPDKSTFSKMQELSTLPNAPVSTNRLAPVFSGMRQTQFLRYYNHPEFDKLGFSPYANMENFYNENSTIWDDMERMRGQWFSLAGTGLNSVYGSLTSGTDYLEPDLASASEFEDIMAISSSTRGGVGGFINNLAANSAYTGGILASIAIEEVILAGAAALQGGMNPVSDAALIARTAKNTVTGTKALYSFTKLFERTRKILQKAKELETARDFFTAVKSGGKMSLNLLGKGFTPNTVKAFRNIKTAENAGQNMSNLAKMSTKFGGFYRDLRAVNLAMAESKLEAGMVYNQVMRQGLTEASNKNMGKGPGEDFEGDIANAANNASFKAMLANAPLIYASNWFVIGNALGGFQRGIQRTLGNTFQKGFAKNIVNTAGKKVVNSAGELIKSPFKYVGNSFSNMWGKVKAGGFKGLTGAGSIAMLDYFAANVAEGIQEIGQEAISAATVGYYTEILDNPAQGGIDLRNQMIMSAMGDQFSAEGANVFLSGFLMGGLVSGPQKLFFQGVPSIYNYGLQQAGIGLASKSQKEAYAEYKKNREEMIDEVVKSYNKSWDTQAYDPSDLFDLTRMNFMVQKEAAESIRKNVFSQDRFGVIDAKDASKFSQYNYMFATGGSANFKNQLQGFLELSDEELIQAFPNVSKQDKQSGKLRERITSMMTSMDKIEDSYNRNKDKNVNPFNKNKYNRKTQETEYIAEALNQYAYDHVRYLQMFTENGFNRALERADGIYSILESEPLFKGMSANDITVLLDSDSIEKEISMLQQQIAATEGADKGLGESNKTKRQKIKRLTAMYKIVTDPQNRFKNGTFKRNKLLKGKLRSEFKNYVRFMASSKGEFVSEDKIDTALEQIVDYGALKGRARVYDKAIQYLQNPEKFAEIQQRQYEVNKVIYGKRAEITRRSVEKYTEVVEANEFVNQLAKEGIFADIGEMEMFLKTGNINFLQTFYDDNGLINPAVHEIKHGMIQRLIGDWKSTRKDVKPEEEKSEEEAAVEQTEDSRNKLDTLLDKAGITIDIDTTTNSPLVVKALKKNYALYRARQTRLGLPILDSVEWANSAEALDVRNTVNALKRIWASGEASVNSADGTLIFNNPKESDIINGDIGFEEFLQDSEVLINNPLVQSVLNQSTLDLSNIVSMAETELEEGESLPDTPQRQFYKGGLAGDIYKITTFDKTNNTTDVSYQILDKSGNPLSKEYLDFLDDNFASVQGTFLEKEAQIAKDALDALDETMPDTTEFSFDGVGGLTYGQPVYKGSVKYIVVQKPQYSNRFGDNQKLKVIKESENVGPISERKFEFIEQGDFANNFTVEETTFNLLPDSVTKIQIKDLTTLYPHTNYTELGAGENSIARESAIRSDNLKAKDRFNMILSELSPSEIEGLEFVVSLDPNGGNVRGAYTAKNRDGKIYKEANPLIDARTSKYIIGVRIANPKLRADINNKLIDSGMEISNSPEEVFAYLNNEAFIIRDQRTGKEIDPRSMNNEQASNVILQPNKNLTLEEKQAALSKVQNDFALNALIVQSFDKLDIGSTPQYFVAGSKELPFTIDLTAGGGKVAYAKSRERVYPIPMDALQYDTADSEGNLFVFNLKYNKETGQRDYDFTTNLKGAERDALEDAVELQLKKQNQWDNLLRAGKGTDRYLAMVRLPNGTFAKVNLKPTVYTTEELDAKQVEVVEAAKRIGAIKSMEKSIEEAVKYNAELQDSLFLSSKPGNLIELNVGPDGSIFLSLDNTNTKTSFNIGLTPEEVNATDRSAKDVINDLVEKFNLDTDGGGRVEKLSAELKSGNFRRSFPTDTDPQTIYDNAVTEVLPEVVEAQTVEVSASSDAIQLSRDIAFIPSNDKSKKVEEEGELGRERPTAEEDVDSVAYMEDAEFEEKLANVSQAGIGDMQKHIDHITNKILRNEGELNERELELMKEPFISQSVNLGVATMGGPGALASADSVEAGIETRLDKVNAELNSLRAELEKGLSKKEKIKAVRSSEKYKKLLAEKKKLEKGANKLIEVTTNRGRIEDYNKFLDWAADNLPEVIGIANLTTLANNGISEGYQRVGAFVMNLDRIANGININGTLYTSENSPYKYHEAFHGVFRMVLSQEEINKYRKIAKSELKAKYGSTYKTQLERFRNSAEAYQEMTALELENEFAEEYLADEFDNFKMKPSSSKTNADVKNLFTRIIEWIKSVFGKYSANELNTLFENIDAGKYKNAVIQANEFTQLDTSLSGSISVANATVRYGSASKVVAEGEPAGQLYVDTDVIDPLIRSMAGMFVNRVNKLSLKEQSYNPTEIYNDLEIDFMLMLDPAAAINSSFTGAKRKYLEQLDQAFINYPEDIKKEVFNLINIISDMDQSNALIVENIEDATGLRSTSEFNKDAAEIGGYNSLSFKVRSYIATTTLVGTDFFGKTELTEGEPLIVPVKFNEAYNSILKSVSNESDPVTMLKRMFSYSRLNPQGKAVVDKLFNDTGLSIEKLMTEDPFKDLKDGSLLISMLKGFENYKVDYIFNERDSNGNLLIYTASERDDINSQLDEWAQAFITKQKLALSDPKRVKDFLRLTKNMKEVMTSYPEDTSTIIGVSREFSQKMFDLIGIRLSPNYIAFSIASAKTESDLENSPELGALKQGYSDSTPLSNELLDQLYTGFKNNVNIFSKKEDGMASRLTTLSINNATFDETIGASTFVNPNGDVVYAHQLPTYHLKAIQALNTSVKRDQLMQDEYLKNNYLLNNEAFNELANQNRIKVIRIAGSKLKNQIETNDDSQTTEDILNESISKNKSTQSFGEFTPQEFAISLINNYTANFNRRSGKVETVVGLGKQDIALAPVFLRVMEAANTGDLTSLPIIKAVSIKADGSINLTPQAINVFMDSISAEFERINRETIEYQKSTGEIEGFNDSLEGRAFSFTNNEMLISGSLQESLINIAMQSGAKEEVISFEKAVSLAQGVSMAGIRSEVTKSLNESFKEFDTLLQDLKVKDNLSKQVLQGLTIGEGVARTSIELSGLKLNLNTNTSHNLQQIFFNNWIISKSINDLLLGDQAVSLKDMVDRVKRAKLQNAAYYSASSKVVDPSKGIFHESTNFDMFSFQEPKAKSSLTNNNIDLADAQAYITTKGVRYATFAFGRLSPAMSNMLDDIDVGNPIDADRAYGTEENTINLSEQQDFINSKKYVYMDGKTAIKMSVTVLTKEYTSNYNDNLGKWEAKPNMVELHYLREQMEANEEKNQNFAMAAPLSAIKMMKQSVNRLNPESGKFDKTRDLTSINLDTSYLGLQVINPSNKKIVTDMSQIKELITSEQDDNVEVEGMVDENGETMNVGALKVAYNKAVSERVTLKYKNKRNLIFSFDTALDEFELSKEAGAITPNLAAFLLEAQTSLQASGVSSNLLEFFSLEDGAQKYNLNSPVTAKRFESLFLTYFSKGTLREKVPGDAFALVSSFGHKVYRRVFEIKDGVPIRSEIVRESSMKGVTPEVSIDDLLQSAIPAEGVIVLDDLRTGVMEYKNGKPTGLRYSEVIMPPMDKNIMSLIYNSENASIPDAISKMFGVRIPTQDKHSAVNMKVVDFMPVYYGSSAIFPKELVEISGADFDIDKVYALMKEYYLDSNKNFVEYGAGNSYFEYVKYMNRQVKQAGNPIRTASDLYKDEVLSIRIDNALTDSEKNRLTDANGINKISEEALRAMLVLGLPATQAQFKSYVEKNGTPNEAVLNNRIVDLRYALAGNRGMTGSELSVLNDGQLKYDLPIAYQSADLAVLEDLFKRFSSTDSGMELFQNRVDSSVDVDNLTGMIKAFEANKGAAIGAIVKPNLYLSLLREYKIKLKSPIKFNNNTYDGFTQNEIDGVRIQDIVSSLITMETDNAKERLISKLGLNIQAVGIAGNMLSLGVSLDTTILLLNSAEVRDLFALALNKDDQFDPSLNTLLKQRIAQLSKNITDQKTKGNKPTFVRLTDEFLKTAVDSTEDLTDNERIQILYLFKKFNDLKTYTSKMGSVTALTKGLPQNIPAVKKTIQDLQELFDKKTALMNLSPLYKSKTWQSTYLKIFSQIYSDLLPNTLLTMSSEFASVLDPVYSGMNTDDRGFDNETRNVIEQDLLSYLTIKSYQKLLNNSSGNSSVENTLIYPGPVGATDLSLIKKINDYQLVREEQDLESNYFLDSFIGTNYAGTASNKTGLNLVVADTWRRLNSANKIDLQTSFARLYGSIETRELAEDVLHYMMVKDGLQLKYGTLMSAMSPFVMNKYLTNVASVEKALKGQLDFEKVFGLSKQEVMSEFKYGYLQSNVVGPLLHTYDASALQDGFVWDPTTIPNKFTVTSDDYHGKEFIRIKSERNGFSGIAYYTTFRLLEQEQENVYEYVEISSMGSNQQFGGGFVGGPRLTYQQTRNLGRGTQQNDYPANAYELSKDELLEDYSQVDGKPVGTGVGIVDTNLEKKQEITEALNSESAIINQTNDSVSVKVDEDAKEVNISKEQLMLQELSKNQKSFIFDENGNSIIEDTDQSLPEQTEEEQQETEELNEGLKDSVEDAEASILEEWWSKNIVGNPAAIEALRVDGIQSIDDAKLLYGDMFSQSEDGQQQLIDRLKCLI